MLSQWEKGRIQPTMRSVNRIAEALECSIDELVLGRISAAAPGHADDEILRRELKGRIAFLKSEVSARNGIIKRLLAS